MPDAAPWPLSSAWRIWANRAGGLVSISSATAVAVALVLDLLARDSLWLGAGSTLLQAVVGAWLLSDLMKRKPWRTARLRALVVEFSTLFVALLFVAARVHVLAEALQGRIAPLVATDILRGYGAVVLLACGASLWERSGDHLALLSKLDLKPVQTVVLSFGIAIVAGTLLLSLPFSVTAADHVSVFDAFFVATSAVCVTGLSVVDVASTYSRFGQVILLLLVQAGGLGIMFLFAAFAVLSGRRLSARSEHELGESAGASGSGKALRRALRFILLTTFGLEIAGAFLLLPAMLEADPDGGVFHAIFHAVSAFCQAGFSTLPGGLSGMGTGTMAILGALVIVGGLGAPVLSPLLLYTRGRLTTLPLHAKLSLWTTAVLLVAGFSGLLLFESGRSLLSATFAGRLGHAMFLSVSSRTAGFDSLGLGALSPAGAAWLMLLMLVGASPGSTGGGLKTTTFAVLGLSLAAVLRRRDEVTAFGRSLPQEDVLRAIALAWSGLSVVAAGTLLLLALEDLPALSVAFEAFSAFSTAGMSLGITPELSAPGRLVVVALMFAGRLGPLTLLAAFFDRRNDARVRYPTQHVQFG